jgi:hypothetical protein
MSIIKLKNVVMKTQNIKTNESKELLNNHHANDVKNTNFNLMVSRSNVDILFKLAFWPKFLK